DLKGEIDVESKNINSLIRQISDINDQVKEIEPHGLLANDLYDKRDNLIDELSNIVNIKVSYNKSSDSSLDIADGLASIELVDSHGKRFAKGDNEKTKLLNGETGVIKEINVFYSDEGDAVSQITVGEDEFSAEEFLASGSLLGNIESYG